VPGPPTTKYDLPTIDAGADFINAYPPIFNEAVTTLSELIASATEEMPRPAAGIFGRFHRNPDTDALSFDTGTDWLELSSADAAAAGATFVGMMTVDVGNTGDIVTATQEWMKPDGRLINRITYDAYFARVGHAHNGGVDPGSNMVRLPDYRGRAIVGADDMGTGAAGRLPNSNRVRGQSGGEERHVNTVNEMPRHSHTLQGANNLSSGGGGYHAQLIGQPVNWNNVSPGTDGTGGDQPHNNMQPYGVDNLLVRVR
jgi:microcystin-dependent protein